MECCGTCGNNCYDGGEFVCSCEASDAYGCPTERANHRAEGDI